MSEAKHTPGPWSVAPPDCRFCARGTAASVHGPTDEKGEYVHVADVAGIIYGPVDDPALANARLIAAAPDLLAACEAAMPILRAHIPPDNFDGHAARALIMVRDAVLKAKGENTQEG